MDNPPRTASSAPAMPPKPNPFIRALDISATFLFAIEGALAAIQAHLDLLGVLVLGFTTAFGGGVIRDLLFGATPPAALRDWRYAALAFTGGAIAFLCYPLISTLPPIVLIGVDAAGLALFCVAGTEKELLYGIPPFIAALLGAITAVGGGTLRDVLLARIPLVLRADFYATAALCGALAVVAGQKFGLRPRFAGLGGFLVCFLLRLIAVRLHWHLPVLAESQS